MGRGYLTGVFRFSPPNATLHEQAFERIVLTREFSEKVHDSHLHNEVPALRKHSIQSKARTTIQV